MKFRIPEPGFRIQALGLGDAGASGFRFKDMGVSEDRGR